MELRTAEFVLPVPLQPKARPRFSRGSGAYTDRKYADWMKSCRAILREWWTRPPLGKGEVVAVHFTFYGPGTSDLDNLQGAVMDAGNGIVWVDDRVTVLKKIVAEWEQSPLTSQSIKLEVIWR
ncbi:RusA family crossover junction endodeoxyribonuclease [Synechococcus phage S-SRP02]|nr:RusA family crossover junction endodeoxyribonuclease [Synechococcus phage S-SRP02]